MCVGLCVLMSVGMEGAGSETVFLTTRVKHGKRPKTSSAHLGERLSMGMADHGGPAAFLLLLHQFIK